MQNMSKDRLRVTDAQNNLLCRFFEDNPEVIKGYKKTSKQIEAVQSKWKKITPKLNCLGPPRNYKAWAKESHTSDCDMEEETKLEQNDGDSFEETHSWQETDIKSPIQAQNPSPIETQNPSYIKLTNDSINEPHIFTNINESDDEFDTFGRNIAQQLRSLPLPVALETQEMLLSVLRKQRLRALNCNINIDPLDK